MKNKIFNLVSSLKYLILLMIIVTLFAGMVYLVAQQLLRQNANEIPTQEAMSVIYKLSSGVPLSDFSKTDNIDMLATLEPFFQIYDSSKVLVTSSAVIGTTTPIVPNGVLLYVDEAGLANNVTWQPKTRVRAAIVVMPINDKNFTGYVVGGRSLKETEIIIDKLLVVSALGWAASEFLVIISFILLNNWRSKKIS